MRRKLAALAFAGAILHVPVPAWSAVYGQNSSYIGGGYIFVYRDTISTNPETDFPVHGIIGARLVPQPWVDDSLLNVASVQDEASIYCAPGTWYFDGQSRSTGKGFLGGTLSYRYIPNMMACSA